jgi:uncharacterized secreted protein with C-terminal beta-propeller domain
MKKIILFAILIIGAVFFIRFLTPEDTWIKVGDKWVQHGQPSAPSPENKIQKFGSVEELRAFLEENRNAEQGGMGGGGEMAVMRDFGTNLKTEALPAAASAEKPDYSKTNVQVEGVDEADIVKTDGKYIYAVSGNNLFIISASPAESSSILAKIEFKSTPTDIYINGNSLVVYGYNNQIYDATWYKKFKRQSPYTFFKVFDVADHKNPRQRRDLDFEGNVTASRMIGDFVYLITNYYSYGFDPIPYPRVLQNGEMASRAVPDMFYFDLPYDSFNFVSVSAINIKEYSSGVKSSAYLLPQAQNVYVSEKSIYLTYTRYVSEEELTAEVMKEVLYPKLSAKEKTRISAIENSPNYVLSKSEKLRKISQLMQMYLTFLPPAEQDTLQETVEKKLKEKYKDLSKELEKTVVHKIAINNANLDYKNYGEVTGSVLNQFSMDESTAGDFRIATTKNRTWSQFEENVNSNKSYNNLYVLDSGMNTVGRLEDLAFDERIYSVRFMGERAYLVTFKQTDPLFVIDLKNPRNPQVLGKLKVPGFSQYLHPYDENTLIGFGKETSETESGAAMTEGLKLSLFDVSDVNNLREIDKVVIGERSANSVALYDHKAFLFSKDKNLLVIPVEVQEEKATAFPCTELGSCGGFTASYFRGAVVYEITKNGFKLKGQINHADNAEVSSGDWWGYGSYDTTVKRSLYIGDVLYTLSDKYVKANKISDLTLVKNLELKKEAKEDFKIVN